MNSDQSGYKANTGVFVKGGEYMTFGKANELTYNIGVNTEIREWR
jgi:hypothetical protein